MNNGKVSTSYIQCFALLMGAIIISTSLKPFLHLTIEKQGAPCNPTAVLAYRNPSLASYVGFFFTHFLLLASSTKAIVENSIRRSWTCWIQLISDLVYQLCLRWDRADLLCLLQQRKLMAVACFSQGTTSHVETHLACGHCKAHGSRQRCVANVNFTTSINLSTCKCIFTLPYSNL